MAGLFNYKKFRVAAIWTAVAGVIAVGIGISIGDASFANALTNSHSSQVPEVEYGMAGYFADDVRDRMYSTFETLAPELQHELKSDLQTILGSFPKL